MIKYLLFLVMLIAAPPSMAQVSPEVEKLPSDWTRLTEQGGEQLVYNTCDGGNLQLRLFKHGMGWRLLCHGQQEDYQYIVTKATHKNDMLVFECVSEGGTEKQQFTFQWIDKGKGLARWEGIGWDWKDLFVSLYHEVDYPHEIQPCKECFDEEECAGMDDYYEPIDAIRAVFSNYVHFGESTDSKENKAAMIKSLDKLKGKKLSQDDLQLLVNVWMYYDPTDFGDAISKSKSLLKANRAEAAKAVKFRIANKREWEQDDSAPYSDLPALLKEIEGK